MLLPNLWQYTVCVVKTVWSCMQHMKSTDLLLFKSALQPANLCIMAYSIFSLMFAIYLITYWKHSNPQKMIFATVILASFMPLLKVYLLALRYQYKKINLQVLIWIFLYKIFNFGNILLDKNRCLKLIITQHVCHSRFAFV